MEKYEALQVLRHKLKVKIHKVVSEYNVLSRSVRTRSDNERLIALEAVLEAFNELNEEIEDEINAYK